MSKEMEYELMDVFISHSSKDKAKFIEPLVVALEAAGIGCWFDATQISPGNSLVDEINHGLTHSKLILFCLSQNFFTAKWAKEELRIAARTSVKSMNRLRMIPLMLDDPKIIQKEYPIPFGNMKYIAWSDDTEHMISQIKLALSEIDSTDKSYWLGEARLAFTKGDYVKSAIFSRKSIVHDTSYFASYVDYIASLLKLGKNEQVWSLLREMDEDWSNMEEDGVDLATYDFVQDTITKVITGQAVDDVTFVFAVRNFLYRDLNAKKGWRYLIRLYDTPAFKIMQNSIVVYAGLFGRNDALDWIGNVPVHSNEKEVREAVANIIYPMAANLLEARSDLVAIAKILIKDEEEEVRSLALITAYYFATNGSEIAVKALFDGASIVQFQALELLSGSYNMIVDEDWNVKTRDYSETQDPDPLLTAELVTQLLKNPDDEFFQEVIELITDRTISCPVDIDLFELADARGNSSENRETKVGILAFYDTPESDSKLIEFAFDPDEFVRSAAIEALEESSRSLPQKFLKRLYKNESVASVKQDVIDLIIAKGNAEIEEVFLEIFNEQITKGTRLSEDVFNKLLGSSRSTVEKALDLCLKHKKWNILVGNLFALVDLDFPKLVDYIVSICFENQTRVESALLVAGKLTSIPIETITSFNMDNDLDIRVAALRALECRLQDGDSLKTLKTMFPDTLEAVKGGDLQVAWTALRIADAFLEFDSRESAIEMYNECYDCLFEVNESTFPLRATWARLNILGVSKLHSVYKDFDSEAPHPWPTIKGPYYGIAVR